MIIILLHYYLKLSHYEIKEQVAFTNSNIKIDGPDEIYLAQWVGCIPTQ
jgi:hypothetical protein